IGERNRRNSSCPCTQYRQVQFMAMLADEDFSKKAFADYLKSQHGIQSPAWEAEPNGKATVPDFHLHYRSLTYAVEVTALMSQYEQEKGNTISELGIWNSTERLADEVEREAMEKGLLRGAYILTLDGPYNFFNSSRKEIKNLLMDFISSTRCVDR